MFGVGGDGNIKNIGKHWKTIKKLPSQMNDGVAPPMEHHSPDLTKQPMRSVKTQGKPKKGGAGQGMQGGQGKPRQG